MYSTWNLSLRRVLAVTLVAEIDTSGLWNTKVVIDSAEWLVKKVF